jgi:hypothetical protein
VNLSVGANNLFNTHPDKQTRRFFSTIRSRTAIPTSEPIRRSRRSGSMAAITTPSWVDVLIDVIRRRRAASALASVSTKGAQHGR